MHSSKAVSHCRSRASAVAARRSPLELKAVKTRRLRLELLETRNLLSVAAAIDVPANAGALADPAALQFQHIVYDPVTHAPLPATVGLPGVAPNITPMSSSPVGMTPAQIRTAYGISSISIGSITGNGAGQTIAIIDAYNDPNIVSDLHQFDLQFGLNDPPSFKVLNETGGTRPPTASGSSGWSLEEALDVEWAHAVAPQANLILFEAKSAYDQDLISTAVNTAATPPA